MLARAMTKRSRIYSTKLRLVAVFFHLHGCGLELLCIQLRRPTHFVDLDQQSGIELMEKARHLDCSYHIFQLQGINGRL